MNRRTLIFGGLAAALVTGIACDLGDVGGDPVGPHSEPLADPSAQPTPWSAPKDWHVDEHTLWGMQITAWVEPESGPFRITIDAYDETDKVAINVIDSHKELGFEVPIGREFVVPVAYLAHHRITLSIHATCLGAKVPVLGFLAVRERADRPRSDYAKSVGFNGTKAAQLDYVTQRP